MVGTAREWDSVLSKEVIYGARHVVCTFLELGELQTSILVKLGLGYMIGTLCSLKVGSRILLDIDVATLRFPSYRIHHRHDPPHLSEEYPRNQLEYQTTEHHEC